MSELIIDKGEEVTTPMHIDDFVTYGKLKSHQVGYRQECYARWLFLHWRLPAITKWAFDQFMNDKQLYCTYDGERYRVTGASRLGDVWLTKDFKQYTGYQKRVGVDDCSNWCDTPKA